MKKYIITIILATLIMTPAAFAEEIGNREVDPEGVIFRSSLSEMVDILNDTNETYSDDKYFEVVDPNNMPWFKQMRLRFSNSYLYYSNRPQKAKNPSKLKTWLKRNDSSENNTESENITKEEINSELSNTITEVINSPSEDTISLEGGINKEKTDKQMVLDAENINFDDETGDMLATGRPKLYFPPQNTVVVADKMVYNEGGNILRAIGNVVVTKDGVPMETDELEINMNEETLFLNKLTLNSSNMIIEAQDAKQQEGLLILNNGSLKSSNSYVYTIATRMAGPDFTSFIPDPTMETLFFGNPKNKLAVHAKYIGIDARKNHDIIEAKKIEFSHNDKVFFKWPSIKMYTNKEHNYFEGNYPEFGSRRKLGMFAGPGLAFSGPFGSVMKVVPFVNYRKGDWGIGGLVKYLNKYNRTEIGYGTAKNIFFLKGKQRLDDNLYLTYAYNSFTDEWFLGGRIPKYVAELYFDKSYPNKNFLGEGRDLTFRQRVGFGFMKDDNKSYNGEHFNDATNMSTTRTRYMAEIRQNVYKYRNEKERIKVQLDALLQGSAALYGTGDTQFVARFGPSLRIQYKNWMQDVSYFLTGYDDHTPLQHYDTYRYGRSSLRVTEAFKITRYFSIGWTGYVNLSHDAPNGKIFQENAFLFAFGPDDFKVILGYDFIRDRTYFGVNIAFDPKGTNVTYDKLVIKNPERLGKADQKEREIAFVISPKEDVTQMQDKKFLRPSTVQKDTKILQYATVIDLEDPDKEKIE